ncbi:hypothetical protein L7F22_052207 [Adiantum nelumboides]|nr:hypothetical protein [Adiantum nelumboides]
MLKALPNGFIAAIINNQIAIALHFHAIRIAQSPHHAPIPIDEQQLLAAVHLQLDQHFASLLKGHSDLEGPNRNEERGAGAIAAAALHLCCHAQADGEGNVGRGRGGGFEGAEEAEREAFRARGEGGRAEDGGEEGEGGDACVRIERGRRGGEGEVGREAPGRGEGQTLRICSMNQECMWKD